MPKACYMIVTERIQQGITLVRCKANPAAEWPGRYAMLLECNILMKEN